MQLPQFGSPLSADQLNLLKAFATNCRSSIMQMVTNSQSGHPGGSLSTIDYLAVLYAFIINQTNEPVIVSNGHISPAVYSVLAEVGAIDKQRAIQNFRKANDVFEGHINRHVNGVWYGTGPLGVGASVAAGLAHSQKLKNESQKTYLIMGDGENQEGQAYEVMNYANKYKLNNLILFIDFNKVQLTASLEEIMPTNLAGHYAAAGWEVIDCDGHDYQEIWKALCAAQNSTKPVCILGHTIMGKGIDFMEATGLAHKADWHGKAPSPEQTSASINQVTVSNDELKLIEEFLKEYPTKIKTVASTPAPEIKTGNVRTYSAETLTDCRSAYGAALKDLAELNPQVLALTADLSESVKTGGVAEVDSNRHIDVGIAEQHMVSCSGGLSLTGFVPFCSTFGAFMSSRAKDQARVNDINHVNVKMVATHCGLSVGEDGPTHQAIDDISSFAGFFHTQVFEPADPNQCDRIIRYLAKTPGCFYVRMGRAKTPVITKADGTVYYDENYEFKPGQADVIREGTDVTILAAGPMVAYALKAAGEFTPGSIEIIAVSSFQPFDAHTVANSLRKTGKLITVHDHNVHTGLANYANQLIANEGLQIKTKHLGVTEYQLSGTADELYEKSGIGVNGIIRAIQALS